MTRRFATILERGDTLAVTLLRITVGLIFVVHGAIKLSDVPGTAQSFAQSGIPFSSVAVLFAIAGELGGGLGILLGLLTRLAATGTLAVMVAAIAFVHYGHGLLGKNGGWEYPLTLLVASLFFITHGAGPWSVDAILDKARRAPQQRPAASPG
jgi:putative oxidoreductase